MRCSMSPKFEVRVVLRTLEEAGLENKLPIYDDGRMIVEEGHMAEGPYDVCHEKIPSALWSGAVGVEARTEKAKCGRTTICIPR